MKEIEQILEMLCRKDNHVSGDSGNSNKYAIKKVSVRRALTKAYNQGREAEKDEIWKIVARTGSEKMRPVLLDHLTK